jgi:hypothetical protein
VVLASCMIRLPAECPGRRYALKELPQPQVVFA